MGTTALYVPDVQTVCPETPYEHLGVPVGTEITQQLKDFWDKIITRFRRIADLWLRFFLSLKGRVLIANSLMMSIPRYAMRFLELPTETKKILAAEYHRMVWDDKSAGQISILHACCEPTEGGIGCMDLQCIEGASVISAVTRALLHPQLPWVPILTDVLIRCGPQGRRLPFSEPITNPWAQHLGPQHNVPQGAGHIWRSWWKLLRDENNGVFIRSPPSSIDQVLSTPLWFHPRMGDGRRWNSAIWKELWHLGVRVLGDVWDPITDSPLLPRGNRWTGSKRLTAIRVLQRTVQDIPAEWKLLATTRPTWTEGQPPRDELMSLLKKPLRDLSYAQAYKLLLKRRLQGKNFNELIEPHLIKYRELCRQEISAPKLWSKVRFQFGLPKAGDLLWRFFHQKVRTGEDLTWVEADRQVCPLHQVPLSHEHIWLQCSVALSVWEEFEEIWQHAAHAPPPRTPQSMVELMVMMADSPGFSGIDKRRWLILFQGAVWTIWKAYLTHSFAQPVQHWAPIVAKRCYREYVNRRVLTDRILCITERYQSRDYTGQIFQDLWGEDPKALKIRQGPLCIRRGHPADGNEGALPANSQ